MAETKKKILIVEDERKISQVVQVNLMMAGYDCEVAADGEEGLRMALTGNFDLILLDLMLPKRDGFSVCREIRKTMDTPIIMVTAKEEADDKVMGLELTITPLGLIAFAAGVGATVCAVRCLHKMEVKRALRKQAKALKAENKAKIAEVKAEAKEEVKAAEAKAAEIAE